VDRETLRDLFRKAGCFVQPGIEDFGISAVEALACGCPVVAVAEGGVLDIVEDGQHGVLYDGAGDAAALKAAIDKSRTIGFNRLNLRRRAEELSTANFEERFRALLCRALPGRVLP
jgi:glycosyltransferase involved in cell wall biosynthesis